VLSRKHLFALLLLLASLSPLYIAIGDSSSLRLDTGQAALVTLNGSEYCYVWVEGIDTSKELLWVHVAEKENPTIVVETHKLAINEEFSITHEHTELIVSLKGIVDRDTVLLELMTHAKNETIGISTEDLAPAGAGDSGSLVLSASVVIASTLISAAWCLTQGMTINASTTAETGKSSNWGITLSISGYIILAFGFLTGLTLLSPAIVPLTVIISVLIILGFVLALFMISSSGSGRGVRSATGVNKS